MRSMPALVCRQATIAAEPDIRMVDAACRFYHRTMSKSPLIARVTIG